MGQSLFVSYLHITFSTKDRRTFLKQEAHQQALWAYMAGICKRLNGPSLLINGVEDHVHLLVRQSKVHAMSDYMREMKKASSIWMSNNGIPEFAWQDGYGAFSVSPGHLEAVRVYIARQQEHHRKESFQEEFLRLLEKYDVEYDERYLWK